MLDEPKNISDKDILEAIRGVKFGSVEITIHDNKVVQLDRTEKIRAVPKPDNRKN